MRIFALVTGMLGVLLGGLWLLQGLGIVYMRPLLCFANCEPVQGPSVTWVIAGVVLLAAGVLAIGYAQNRRTGGRA